MKADTPIIVNRANTTPFQTVTQVIYYIVTMLRDEVKDETKREHLDVLRQMLNEIH